VIATVLKGSYLTIKDRDCPEILQSIVEDIFEDPKERPSFTEIVARIEESYVKICSI
jgi:hypothetical protein